MLIRPERLVERRGSQVDYVPGGYHVFRLERQARLPRGAERRQSAFTNGISLGPDVLLCEQGRVFAHFSEGQDEAPRSCPRLTAGREMNPFFGLPASVIPGAPLRGGSLLEELYLRVPPKDMCVVRGRRAGAGHLRVCDFPGFCARAPFFPLLNLKMTLLEASNVELTLK